MSNHIWGIATDKGEYREKNQDRVLCQQVFSAKRRILLACVCDGVGSFEYSEQSSEMVINGLKLWLEGIQNNLLLSSEQKIQEDLLLTLEEINEIIYQRQRDEKIRLGCTMSLMLLINRKYYVIHVGDSRIYYGKNKLNMITQDEVSYSETDGRKKLHNCIGLRRNIQMIHFEGKLERNAVIIIGSDGLFNLQDVSGYSKEIRKVNTSEKMQYLCRDYINRARDYGERDNISCIIIRNKALVPW